MNKSVTVRRVAALLAAVCIAVLCIIPAFADDGELTCMSSGVTDGQSNVSANPTVTITFSDSVSGASVRSTNTNGFSLTDSRSNEIPLDVRFSESDGRIASVTPRSALTAGETYTFRIKESITSDSGRRLSSEKTIRFTVANNQTTSTTATTTARANVSVTTTTAPAGSPGSGSSSGTTSRQATTGSAVPSAPPISTRIARSVRGRPSSGGNADKTTKAERTTRAITSRETTTRMPETAEIPYTRPETTTRYIPETVTQIIRPTRNIDEETYPEAEEDTGYTYDYRTEAYYEPPTQILETAPSEYPNLEKYYKEEEPTADNSALPFVIIAEVALIALPVAGLLYLLKRKSSAGGAEAFIPQEEAGEESHGGSDETQENDGEKETEEDTESEGEEMTDGPEEEAQENPETEETGAEESEEEAVEDTEDTDEDSDGN